MSFWGGFTTRTGFLLNNFSWEVKTAVITTSVGGQLFQNKVERWTHKYWLMRRDIFVCWTCVGMMFVSFWFLVAQVIRSDWRPWWRTQMIFASGGCFALQVHYKYDSSIYAHIYTRVIALSLSLCLYIYIYICTYSYAATHADNCQQTAQCLRRSAVYCFSQIPKHLSNE